ncbi:MAG TPA: hypothetical protein VL221_03410 [Bacteroidota bacterium]|nr:hypothetical protein [Bacteroidota bacterium]
MADTICHATQGGLLMLAPFIARIRKKAWLWTLGAVGAFFGALPDIVGAYGIIIRGDQWRLYNVAHFGKLKRILQYVPMYSLHLYVDSFTHGPGKRWWEWNERLWLEVLLWVVNGTVIALFVRIWRRNMRKEEALTAGAARREGEHR